MSTPITSDTELLTEHFGYPPVSLIDDLINSINVLAERALNSVEQGLLNAPPATLGFKSHPSKSSRGRDAAKNQPQQDPAEAARTEIESGTHQLETLLCASIDRNFDKFEIYVLRNILCVRPADVRNWMRLTHYEGLDFSAVASDSSGTANPTPNLDSINHLRRKLRESMRLNALLTAERARNEKLLGELRDLVGASTPQVKSEKTSASPANQGPQSQPQPPSSEPTQQKKESPFAFLHRKGSLTAGGSEAPLSTTTAFTLSQMQALRALSVSLRNLTPDLLPPAPSSPTHPSSPTSTAMDIDTDNNNNNNDSAERGATKKKKSWRRERLEYVEGATRRYLETVEGLELGRHGEVRDGEWQGEGRGLARDEVGGLEAVVTAFGGAEEGEEDAGRSGSDGSGSSSGGRGGGGAARGGRKSAARVTRASSREDRMDES